MKSDEANSNAVQILGSGNVGLFGPGQNPPDSLRKLAFFVLLLLSQGVLHDIPADGHVPDQVVHVDGVVQKGLVLLLSSDQVIIGGKVSSKS